MSSYEKKREDMLNQLNKPPKIPREIKFAGWVVAVIFIAAIVICIWGR